MNKIGYAYLDKGYILHVISDKNTAKQYSINGKYKEVFMLYEGGYPAIKINNDIKHIIMYSATEGYIGGNRNTGTIIKDNEYKEIKDLYKSLI